MLQCNTTNPSQIRHSIQQIRAKSNPHLDENHQRAEKRSGFDQKSSVLCEPFDVAFVAGVDEDRRILGAAAPIGVVDEIPLLEGLVALGIEVEVVEDLSEELGAVAVEGIGGGILRAEEEGRREGNRGNEGEGRSEMEGKEEEKGKESGWRGRRHCCRE